MAESRRPGQTELSPNGAISLALALGVVCTLSGTAVTGYIFDYIEGPRWLMFIWILLLFFGVPGGFVVLSEFTPRAFRKLSIVQGAIRVSRLAFKATFMISTLGFLANPQWIFFVAQFLLILPGPALVGLALLERYALQGRYYD
ncbi:MAG: hypothetical protein AAFZ99_01055 [Pseudomonadota bacterium]